MHYFLIHNLLHEMICELGEVRKCMTLRKLLTNSRGTWADDRHTWIAILGVALQMALQPLKYAQGHAIAPGIYEIL